METSAGCRQAQAPPIKLSLLLTIKAFLRGQNLSGQLNPFSVFSSKKLIYSLLPECSSCDTFLGPLTLSSPEL